MAGLAQEIRRKVALSLKMNQPDIRLRVGLLSRWFNNFIEKTNYIKIFFI
jgi:hypothetical protein